MTPAVIACAGKSAAQLAHLRSVGLDNAALYRYTQRLSKAVSDLFAGVEKLRDDLHALPAEVSEESNRMLRDTIRVDMEALRDISDGCLLYTSVNEEAENNGHDYEQQRNHCNGGVVVIESAVRGEAVEGAGHDRGESGDNQDQGQIREDDEQLLCTLTDIGGNHLADRLAFVADRGKERTEIVHRTEEDASDQDPQHNRDPAERCV